MDLAQSKSQDSFKVIIVGNSSTGKTNIIQTFAKGKQSNINTPTLGIEYYSKVIEIDNRRVKIKILDTAGQQQYRSITTPNVNGALIVFDVTNRTSFNDTYYWINQVRQRSSENVVMGLVGNKIDLQNRRVVSRQEGQNLSSRQNIFYYESTILEQDTINKLFKKLAQEINRNIKTNNLEFSKNNIQLNGYPHQEKQSNCNC